jgi:tripartite-type tricarboxylate transporter receptor subunit TctC
MKHLHTASRLAVAAAAGLSMVAPHGAAAQGYWAGKTVNLVIGSEAGSGYDTYGRVVTRHIHKHLPGRPTVIPQNMGGAGSKRAAEFIALVAPKDATSIALVFPGAIADPMITPRDKWRYDPSKLEFIGTVDSGTRLCATHLDSKVKTFEDARKETVTIGASAPGGSTYDYPTMLNALTGTKFRVVAGYKGTTDISVAIERREVDGWCGIEISTFNSVRPEWLPKKQVNTFVQLGLKPNAEMTALGIPSIWNFVPEQNKKVMELIVSQQVFQRPIIAPPGTPAERVKELQEAFMATMADKEFQADSARLKLQINPQSGPEVAALVKSMYASPPELIERMKNAVRPQ